MVDVTTAMCPFKLLGTVVLFVAIPTICIRCQCHVVRMLTTMPIALRTATNFCVFLVSLFPCARVCDSGQEALRSFAGRLSTNSCSMEV